MEYPIYKKKMPRLTISTIVKQGLRNYLPSYLSQKKKVHLSMILDSDKYLYLAKLRDVFPLNNYRRILNTVVV